MKQVRKPGFFVVGAPKSGTTSLYYYLKQHPEIFLPRIKELYFFCTDLHFRYTILDEEQFLSYYSNFKKEKAGGEVSVWNLLSERAAHGIYNFNPAAKIIILLREPVDMLYALHSNHVFNDNEIITDFEAAVNAVEDRRQGRLISPVIHCPIEGLYYTDIGSYAQQVKRYFEVFGAENVSVILFDDLKNDTSKVYHDILEFLNVSTAFKPKFKIYNSGKQVKSDALKRWMLHGPEWLKGAANKLLPHQSPARDKLNTWLWQINTKAMERKPIRPEFREKLKQHFSADILELQQLIGRDLHSWLS